MVDKIFRSFEYIFQNLMAVLHNMTVATGTGHLIMGTLLAMFVVRFIIYPGLKGGVGASDKASRSRVMEADYREVE